MSRIAFCEACNAIEYGIKSRIAFEHTCGLPQSEWPVQRKVKTWKERLDEEQAKQQDLLSKECQNTQLSDNKLKQLPEQLQKDITAFAAEQTKNLDSRDAHGIGFYCGAVSGITIGAAEYATNLRLAQETIKVLEYDNKQIKGELEGYKVACDELKRWKEEARQLLNPIWDFADKNIKVPLGECKINSVLKYCKKMEELIEEFLYTHENESIIDRELFNKFQNLMDGAE